jgi:HNH endonuclease
MTYEQRYIRERIVITDVDCWEWQLSKDQYGYGQLNKERGERLAHRYSYRAFKGEISPGKVVRHTCDNPVCCNPKHLILGWQADNLKDSRDKGRAYSLTNEDRARGIAISAALRKIPPHIEEDVIQRFNRGEHREDIANHHGIHLSTTNRIIKRKLNHG